MISPDGEIIIASCGRSRRVARYHDRIDVRGLHAESLTLNGQARLAHGGSNSARGALGTRSDESR